MRLEDFLLGVSWICVHFVSVLNDNDNIIAHYQGCQGAVHNDERLNNNEDLTYNIV